MPLAIVLFLSLSSASPQSSPDWPYPESPRVRALSALDGIAALQTKDGDIETVRVGDEIADGVRVVKVLEDRLVVEGTDPSTGDRMTYWIYKAGPTEKASRVVAFGKMAPSRTVAIPPENESGTEPGQEGQEQKTRPKKNPE